MHKILLLSSALGLCLYGCGGAGGAKKKTDSGLTNATLITQTTEVAQAVVDDAAQAAADGLSSGAAFANFISVNAIPLTAVKYGMNNPAWSSICTTTPVDANTNIVVNWTFDLPVETTSFTKGKFTVEKVHTRTGSITRSWLAPTSSAIIGCSVVGSGGHVKFTKWNAIDGASYAGLALTETVARSNTVARTLTRSGVAAVANSHVMTKNGTRNVTWGAVTMDDAATPPTATFTKTITSSSMVTTLKVTKNSVSQIDETSTIAVETANPLTITVVRNKTTRDWISRLINGKVVATQKDATVLKSTFADVKFEQVSDDTATTSANSCIPVSGTVTGNVYATATATEVEKTYLITFNAERIPTIKIGDADAITMDDYEPNCDVAN